MSTVKNIIKHNLILWKGPDGSYIYSPAPLFVLSLIHESIKIPLCCLRNKSKVMSESLKWWKTIWNTEDHLFLYYLFKILILRS